MSAQIYQKILINEWSHAVELFWFVDMHSTALTKAPTLCCDYIFVS